MENQSARVLAIVIKYRGPYLTEDTTATITIDQAQRIRAILLELDAQ